MNTFLEVTGEVKQKRAFSYADLVALPDTVPDIGALIVGRQGGGAYLRSLLRVVEPTDRATYITLHSNDAAFSASVPIEAVRDAVLVFQMGGRPLTEGEGGPVRFYIPNVEQCEVDGVDKCANVKFLGRIDLSSRPGVDTRPRSKRQHDALHEGERP